MEKSLSRRLGTREYCTDKGFEAILPHTGGRMTSTGGTASIAARLERLPAGRAMRTRVFLLSLGGFFEFYDMFLSAYVGPGLVKSGILTSTTPGLFGTTGLAGFVAAFL